MQLAYQIARQPLPTAPVSSILNTDTTDGKESYLHQVLYLRTTEEVIFDEKKFSELWHKKKVPEIKLELKNRTLSTGKSLSDLITSN